MKRAWLAIFFALCASGAHAQSVTRIIVPFAAGGVQDILACAVLGGTDGAGGEGFRRPGRIA